MAIRYSIVNDSATFEMVAKTFFGLEPELAHEIEQLGGTDIKILNRAVSFNGTKEMMYQMNIGIRTALKILIPITSFDAKDETQLYEQVKSVEWLQFMKVSSTFAIEAVVNSTLYKHSGFVGLKVKDAIADYFREKRGARPSVDTVSPNVLINVHISQTKVTLSLDSSGEPLFKRGYRMDRNAAPMSEVLAAGLVLKSGWDQKQTFIDPMCGSGTIVIEAALIAANIAPNILREDYGYKYWLNYDEQLYEQVRKKLISKQMTPQATIIGSDFDERIYHIAIENARNAQVGDYISFSHKPIEEFIPPTGGGLVITNPPYGERLEKDNIIDFYKAIGNRLKSEFTNFTVWILSSNIAALKQVGLHRSKQHIVYNGGLECRFMSFDIYQGSKKNAIK